MNTEKERMKYVERLKDAWVADAIQEDYNIDDEDEKLAGPRALVTMFVCLVVFWGGVFCWWLIATFS